MRLGVDINGNGSWEDIFSFNGLPWYARLVLRLILVAVRFFLKKHSLLADDKSKEKGGDF